MTVLAFLLGLAGGLLAYHLFVSGIALGIAWHSRPPSSGPEALGDAIHALGWFGVFGMRE